MDFLSGFPFLEDGSCAIKLPGVAFDNAAYNSVKACLSFGNAAGAFKLVRANVGNRLRLNVSLLDNSGDNCFYRSRWFADRAHDDPLGEFTDRPKLLDFGRSFETDCCWNFHLKKWRLGKSLKKWRNST